MSKLVTDNFVRRVAKFMLLTIMFFLASICLAFAIIVVLRLLGVVGAADTTLNLFISLLTISFKSEFASFIAIAVGVFPALVASVCYRRNESKDEITEDLNRTGYTFFLIIIFSISVTMLDLLMLSVGDAGRGLGNATYQEPLKNLFTGLLSFLTIYLVQLLGLKPK